MIFYLSKLVDQHFITFVKCMHKPVTGLSFQPTKCHPVNATLIVYFGFKR